MKLNDQQRLSVKLVQGPVLVIAGAGSGKTRVITEKIGYLLKNCDVKPNHIVALTFTNKAAREMRQRVQDSLKGQVPTRGLKITTFHTFGLNFLRRELAAVGLKAGFSLFDDQDTRVILRELLFQDGEADLSEVDLALQKISNWKGNLISPEQALSVVETESDQQLALVYARYQRQLKAYNAVDFEDLIGLPTGVLRDNESVRNRWQRRVRYLLVDEYQDTNTSQYQLIKLLVGERQCFTMVGDDDQSIYAWRGAAPENLRQLSVDYPDLTVVKLEQNYRSTATILDAANAVIANNDHLYEKKLWSQLGPGERIAVWECETDRDEAERVAHEILSSKLRLGRAYGDFAVFYRSNHQSRVLEMSLRTLQIPYNVSGGTSFFARSEIKDIVSYLRLILNHTDDTAFLRIINTPRREIGPATLEQLGSYAASRQISLFQAIDEVGFASQASGPALQRLQRFSQWLLNVHEVMRGQSVRAGLEQLLRDLDYREWLMAKSSSTKVGERRWENVVSLVEMLHKMAENIEDEVKSTETVLERVLGKVILRDILDQQAEDLSGEQVQLMTLHAAKGLEFPFAYLMGVEEETLPHRNSVEAAMLQEERRLFYVGITRAQQRLVLSYATTRKQYGETVACTPSRFLDELPVETIDWQRSDRERTEEEKVQTASVHLSSIRALLSS
ncbi:MAG: 3'-5' exonuclease [Gammaproteobacteria bacterium]